MRDTFGFAIGGIAPLGHLSPPHIRIGKVLMTLDPVWAAAGSPRHAFRTTAREVVQLTGGQIADVKE